MPYNITRRHLINSTKKLNVNVMKKILFYYPSNKRSIQIETTLIELQKLNKEVILLTTCKKGLLHSKVEKSNINTYTNISKYTFSPLYYLSQIVFLIRFCRKQKVDFVFSNLQHSNFIAVISQFFIKAPVIAFRHHFKFNKGNFGIPLSVNKTEVLFDKVINKLSKKIIVPSSGVYEGIKNYEKVDLKKVRIIPYLYDFTKYGSPNKDNVTNIKTKFNGHLLIIMVARLIPFKRHMQLLPTYKKLIYSGLDIKVIILDEGPCSSEIQQYITQNQLEKNIFLIGFTTHFLDYMKASDLLLHPSLTEASNNVVKEIGLMEKAVAVCEGVGDFDDYIVDGKNGYLMTKETPEKDAEEIIRKVYGNKKKLTELGHALRQTILTHFGNNAPIIQQYKTLINES